MLLLLRTSSAETGDMLLLQGRGEIRGTERILNRLCLQPLPALALSIRQEHRSPWQILQKHPHTCFDVFAANFNFQWTNKTSNIFLLPSLLSTVPCSSDGLGFTSTSSAGSDREGMMLYKHLWTHVECEATDPDTLGRENRKGKNSQVSSLHISKCFLMNREGCK